MALADHQCIPCQGGTPPLPPEKVHQLLRQLNPAWTLNQAGHLYASFPFENFQTAMDFANKVTSIAEAEGHHPDLHISWGKCMVEIWTHKINGLTESDFYLAAKIDRLTAQPN